MPDKKITQLPSASLNPSTIFPIVSLGTTSQTSFNDIINSLSLYFTDITATTYITGGTYSNGTAMLNNNTGGTISITGFVADNTYTTGLTFNVGTYDLSISNNDGTTYTQSLGILSSDMTITGGTYDSNSGVGTFTNNSGGTFNVTGFMTGYTDVYTTGGTYNNGDITFTNTDNATFIVSGITGLDNYWISGSTGAYSLKSLNDTSIDATGDYSFATGAYTQANGDYSHAEGLSTVASGHYSHAQGVQTIASGESAHSEGFNSQARGFASHAEGNSAYATGSTSHAEGYFTIAGGIYSHAQGYSTVASGSSSHAEGYRTTAQANYSHAEGYRTQATGNTSHAEGFYSLATGNYSHAEGNQTIASGLTSHAEGMNTRAYGNYSHTEGYYTIASGSSSHVEGQYSNASGQASHAEGDTTVASGTYSHSEGSRTIASGYTAHAEGTYTIAGGNSAHVEGYYSQAIGDFSHAEGYNTQATGQASNTQGYNTIASGYTSHAQGYGTIAGGSYSHAGGVLSKAMGENSTAIGEETQANNYLSFAGGYLTEANGLASFVYGSDSKAIGDFSVVFGNQLTGTSDNTVYVNNLNIHNLTTGTSVSVLGVDADGYVISGNTNISDAIYTVNSNLDANNTSTATTSVMTYGVNVFTGVTSSNYATKLPQPVTGKSVKVINNGSTLLSIYPSNIGGQINNLPIDMPAQVPPDGKPYEFICIVNPLPGAWTFSPPATAQFDSGEITITVTGGTNGGGHYTPVVSAFDANNVNFGQGIHSSTWGYNGKNTAAINNNGTTVAFRPQTPWLGITKIKVYTNIITANTGGDGDDTLVNLLGNCESDLYDIATNGIITNGASALNNTLFNFNLKNTIAGNNALTGKTSTNIGDAGTLWGEKIANTDSNSDVSFGPGFGTVIGQLDKGNITYPYGSGPYVGLQVNKYYTSFISFQMRPLAYTEYGTLTNLKFRFVIEYYA